MFVINCVGYSVNVLFLLKLSRVEFKQLIFKNGCWKF